MAHIALYRTWRPQRFQDVVGQKHIIQTLQNSLKENRLTHAYLFSGPRGTGKTTAAKILAKAVNCERGPAPEPCNECSSCIRITSGAVLDVVELDAASNRGVDEIRDIRDKVKYAPTEVRQKVYIIDEVHMLTTEAFNALLKTLEEPPAHVMFILATTEPHKIPATIISRCQRFDFRKVSLEEQVARLEFVCTQENVEIDLDAMQYIARLSEGGMRDAISLLDQVVSYSGKRITYAEVVAMTGDVAADQFRKLAEAMQAKDIGLALELIDGFMQEGKSADKCIESLIHYFRDILLIKMMPNSQVVTDRILDPAAFTEISAAFSRPEIFAMIEILNHYQVEMKYSAQPQTLFEVAIMKICSASSEVASDTMKAQPGARVSSNELASLKQKLGQLEQQLQRLLQSGVSTAASSSAPAQNNNSAQTSRAQSPQQQSSNTMTTSAQPSTSSAPAAAVKRSSVAMDSYLRSVDSADHKQVKLKWSSVLSQVKDRKITIHAWLTDGEPASIHDDTVLLAFNSAMHRETTEKPANKQLIEQVMTEVFGQPMRFSSMMKKDWNEARSEMVAPVEEMVLEPEEPGVVKEEWIHEAIQLFGEDMVTIKED
ncbi:DNA polymerase III subunit gamma/tau [Paenibacillus psychroresistens]|uniref:DNA-directed DNA polymerase n=1 Tax=Paenibacillus psychroresistens TaxID=1778678 RepID=A0A6B8RUE2_9BACL|nr:DNA polymerase III subunit gamma/tau [Paenibacillus psychroresistens]QGQ99225.1 DNA polymerase III subunit gamma/tau [Paenibacillus psychroresistens]